LRVVARCCAEWRGTRGRLHDRSNCCAPLRTVAPRTAMLPQLGRARCGIVRHRRCPQSLFAALNAFGLFAAGICERQMTSADSSGRPTRPAAARGPWRLLQRAVASRRRLHGPSRRRPPHRRPIDASSLFRGTPTVVRSRRVSASSAPIVMLRANFGYSVPPRAPP